MNRNYNQQSNKIVESITEEYRKRKKKLLQLTVSTIFYILTGERLRMNLIPNDFIIPNPKIYSIPAVKISSYPNPILNNQHLVVISSNESDKKYVISVLDIVGKIVYSSNAYPGENMIDMGDLNNGMYIIEVVSESERLYTSKVVKL